MWKWGLLVISILVLPKEEGPRTLHLSDLRFPARLSPNTRRKKGEVKRSQSSQERALFSSLWEGFKTDTLHHSAPTVSLWPLPASLGDISPSEQIFLQAGYAIPLATGHISRSYTELAQSSVT